MRTQSRSHEQPISTSEDLNVQSAKEPIFYNTVVSQSAVPKTETRSQESIKKLSSHKPSSPVSGFETFASLVLFLVLMNIAAQIAPGLVVGFGAIFGMMFLLLASILIVQLFKSIFKR